MRSSYICLHVPSCPFRADRPTRTPYIPAPFTTLFLTDYYLSLISDSGVDVWGVPRSPFAGPHVVHTHVHLARYGRLRCYVIRSFDSTPFLRFTVVATILRCSFTFTFYRIYTHRYRFLPFHTSPRFGDIVVVLHFEPVDSRPTFALILTDLRAVPLIPLLLVRYVVPILRYHIPRCSGILGDTFD